jgi:hypothetical protein
MFNRSLAIGLLLAACGGGDNSNNNGGVDAAQAIDAAPVFPAGNEIPLATPDGSFYSVLLTANATSFALDIDTGSASVGIAGMACTGCPVTPKYASGSSAVDTHMTAKTQYADGSGWSGEVITDKVGLGHATPDVNVSFVAISTQSNHFFQDNSYQGILGLGPNFLLDGVTTSYVDAIKSAGTKPIMGFEFCDTAGTMWLGGFDATHASTPMQFTPLLPIDGNQNPFYAVNVTDMGIDGTSLGFGSSAFQNPIVDTGTSLFYIPTEVDTAMLAKINASAGFKALFPSSTLSDNGCANGTGVTDAMVNAMLPQMSMSFPGENGGPNFTVSAPAMSSYLYQMGPGQYCFAFADGGSGNQYFGVMGDTILRAFLTVVDLESSRVGFGTDGGCAAKSAIEPFVSRAHGRITEHGHPPHRQR